MCFIFSQSISYIFYFFLALFIVISFLFLSCRAISFIAYLALFLYYFIACWETQCMQEWELCNMQAELMHEYQNNTHIQYLEHTIAHYTCTVLWVFYHEESSFLLITTVHLLSPTWSATSWSTWDYSLCYCLLVHPFSTKNSYLCIYMCFTMVYLWKLNTVFWHPFRHITPSDTQL